MNFLTFDLKENKGTFDHFDITDKDGQLLETIANRNDRQFKVENLTAGTQYTYRVYTNYSLLRSDAFYKIQTFTST